jgi:hypothetical protein
MAVGWALAIACDSFSGSAQPAEEAGVNSATPSEAATADAAPDVVAATGFCARRDAGADLFCADFDEPNYETAWTTKVDSGGVVTLAASDRSPPNALLATTELVGGLGNAQAFLTKQLLRNGANAIALDFDVRIDAIAQSDSGAFYMIVAGVTLTEEPARNYLFIAQPMSTDMALAVNNAKPGPLDLHVVRTPASGWYHTRLEIGFDDGSVNVLINDVKVATSGKGAISTSNDIAFTLKVGLQMAPSPGHTQVALDNVVVQQLR